jgi:hypothetical protein
LWRRPRPKLGCGAKERRRRNTDKFGYSSLYMCITNIVDILSVIQEQKDKWYAQLLQMDPRWIC